MSTTTNQAHASALRSMIHGDCRCRECAALVAAISVLSAALTNDTEKAARKLYGEYSGNHPTIHCNRFPAWEELTEADRDEWRKKAQRNPE